VRHNRAMRVASVFCFALVLAPSLIWAATPAHVHLRLGERTTLHVGQIAVLRLNAARPYSVTLEGEAVAPIGEGQTVEEPQSERTYSYRAVRAGTATLLITPTDQRKGDCVDCVTRHCFLTVVP